MSDETSTEIATFAPDNPVAVFQSADQVDKLIADIEAVVNSHKPDLTTKKGRADIASLARKVVTTKTTLDAAGKKLNEDRRALIDAVDEQRRSIRTRLDALRDKARKPLDDWEAAEVERESSVKRTMDAIDGMLTRAIDANSEELGNYIADLNSLVFDADVFQDWLPIAVAAKSKALESLSGHLTRTQKAEADDAELLRLQQAAAERDEQDRQRIAAEAAIEQERVATAQRLKDEQEIEAKRLKDDADADAKRLADIADAEKRATEAATLKAAQEAQAAIDAATAETKRLQDAEDARVAEAARVQREQDARDADRKHRGEVMKSAKEAIMAHSGAVEEVAKKIVLAIVAGEVPNVTLKF